MVGGDKGCDGSGSSRGSQKADMCRGTETIYRIITFSKATDFGGDGVQRRQNWENPTSWKAVPTIQVQRQPLLKPQRAVRSASGDGLFALRSADRGVAMVAATTSEVSCRC